MVAATCYCDVGGSPSEIAVAPAMLVATPTQWIDFDNRWNDCLRSFGVTALHMKDFAHSVREFKDWKMDEPRRRRFLNNLLWIIEETVTFTTAIAVKMAGFNAVDAEVKLSERARPYTMGCVGCAAHAFKWFQSQNMRMNDVAWIFEKGDQDQNDHPEGLRPPAEVVTAEEIGEHRDEQPEPDEEQEEVQHGQEHLPGAEV